MNLYEEMVSVLTENGKRVDDIEFITIDDMNVPLEKFIKFALSYNYDEGWGSAEVNTNLLICGNGWWLERGEYDGSEWFEYKTLPVKSIKEIDDLRKIDGEWYYKYNNVGEV